MKRHARRIPKRSFKIRLKRAAVYSIVQVIFFSLAALIIISFARSGIILVKINDFLMEIFSWTTIFLPFIFLSFGFLVSKFKNPLAQPNVLVGGTLFFVSLIALTRAGLAGESAWEGISTLITPLGSFIVLMGTLLVGIIVLFNTSVDQALSFIGSILLGLRRYIIGEKKSAQIFSRGSLKVSGGSSLSSQRLLPEKKSINTIQESVLGSEMITSIPTANGVWKYPSPDLLSQTQTGHANRGDIKKNAAIIENTLDSFGITARVVEVNQGPAVTQYAIQVALGTKLSRITALERDLALALAAPTGAIRIEAPIPGKSLVGIELPNITPEFVPLRKMMEQENLRGAKSKLTVALGLDVSGNPIVVDIARMPHVLIAGQTGSGKSVCINTFLACLLMRSSPQEVNIIMVDPKRVELTGYNGIPHLLSPVIVEPEKVVSALKWVLTEMDRRYKAFAEAGVRNIDSYNEMAGLQSLPYIVVVIDELADIMLFSPAEVEDSITRIAQMSRATGIHMVLATQRPSVDIITGIIKANVPCRIAFAVASQVDSRVILDTQGAEKLLGKGDMLYLPPDQAKPMRIQGAFVSDSEISSLISFVKNQGIAPRYTEEVTTMPRSGTMAGVGEVRDELFGEAVKIVCQYDRASASLLQRRLSVGYARAARIIDQLEKYQVVGSPEGSKPREVLVQNAEEFLGNLQNNNQ